ncbi:hypothetical protein V8C43DRAFT_107600 [Trichoderma afarasin]
MCSALQYNMYSMCLHMHIRRILCFVSNTVRPSGPRLAGPCRLLPTKGGGSVTDTCEDGLKKRSKGRETPLMF